MKNSMFACLGICLAIATIAFVGCGSTGEETTDVSISNKNGSPEGGCCESCTSETSTKEKTECCGKCEEGGKETAQCCSKEAKGTEVGATSTVKTEACEDCKTDEACEECKKAAELKAKLEAGESKNK